MQSKEKTLEELLDEAEPMNVEVVKDAIKKFSEKMDEAKIKINKQRNESQKQLIRKRFG